MAPIKDPVKENVRVVVEFELREPDYMLADCFIKEVNTCVAYLREQWDREMYGEPHIDTYHVRVTPTDARFIYEGWEGSVPPDWLGPAPPF